MEYYINVIQYENEMLSLSGKFKAYPVGWKQKAVETNITAY